jgi:hypothetical protein
MTKVRLSDVPWLPFLFCSALALPLPAVYYWHLRSLNNRAFVGNPSDSADIARLGERTKTLLNLMATGTLIGQIEVSVALAMLTCWVVYSRSTGMRPGLGGRALADIALVAAFLLAPWVAGAIGWLELPRGNPLDLWVLGNLWGNLLAGIGAGVAGLAFVIALKRRQPIRPAA